MYGADIDRMTGIAKTMAQSESMWLEICNGVDDDRVEMLIQVMMDQYALAMHEETNANALMALVGFLSQQVLNLHEGSNVSIESAMVLLQIGMQRGVQAHLVVARQEPGNG